MYRLPNCLKAAFLLFSFRLTAESDSYLLNYIHCLADCSFESYAVGLIIEHRKNFSGRWIDP